MGCNAVQLGPQQWNKNSQVSPNNCIMSCCLIALIVGRCLQHLHIYVDFPRSTTSHHTFRRELNTTACMSKVLAQILALAFVDTQWAEPRTQQPLRKSAECCDRPFRACKMMRSWSLTSKSSLSATRSLWSWCSKQPRGRFFLRSMMVRFYIRRQGIDSRYLGLH